jgi:hypothetical protein
MNLSASSWPLPPAPIRNSWGEDQRRSDLLALGSVIVLTIFPETAGVELETLNPDDASGTA